MPVHLLTICHLRAASLVLHEIIHADVLVSAQNGNRRISDIEIKVDNGSGDGNYSDVYGAAMCKNLARTVPKHPNANISLARDGITTNGEFLHPRCLSLAA